MERYLKASASGRLVELGREMKLRAHQQPIQSTPASDGELMTDDQ